MGLNISWKDNVLVTLNDPSARIEQSGLFTLVKFDGASFILHLVSLNSNLIPEDLVSLQKKYSDSGILLVHLWEDVWKKRTHQVIGRIKSALGQNKRIHARKTKLIALHQKQYDEFLEDSHLQGTAKARYKFALVSDDDIVAVAGFSAFRKMKRISENYTSAELIRFATRTGFTVTGGMSKLIKHFCKVMQPDDIMSYADRDWSLGRAYDQSGFQLKEITPPAELWVDIQTMSRYFFHRLPGADSSNDSTIAFTGFRYLKIFNTGNLKYILKCQKTHY